MSKRVAVGVGIMVVLLVLLVVLNLVCGSVNIPAGQVFAILGGSDAAKPGWRYIVIESRLPQVVTAFLSGSGLAVCGLMLQAAFRNPLADPSIFGVSSGAGLGVAFALLMFGGSVSVGSFSATGFIAVFASAFVGAMAVIAIIFLFSLVVRNNVMLLIIGIMVGYLSSSAISLLNFFATEEGVKSYIVWGMGNFSSVSSGYMPIFSIIIILSVISSALLIKPLNVFMLGDEYAENLGINTMRLRNVVLLITGVLVAVSTAFCGPIAFIGLSVPHISRILMRTDDYRRILPATVFTGSLMALVCNFVCNLPGNGGVIPLNAITPLMGAPVVIYVITRRNKLNLNQNIY